MALTQEAILNTLIECRGKLKNSELLNKFTEPLNCSDPEQKKQNRALFKTFVNNIAFVKELEGTKYVMLKKIHHHLLKASNDENKPGADNVEDGSQPDEKEQYTDFRKAEGKKSRFPSNASECSAPRLSIENALERTRIVDFKPKTSVHFTVPLKPDYTEDKYVPAKKEASTNKPFALPLRMPQIDFTPRVKKPSPENPGSVDPGQEAQSSPQHKRKTDGSPQLRKHFKTPKHMEPKSEMLDRTEHELLVKSASGQWDHVYGILLKDIQLAEKKDFMSGFTVLHWAVKYGNDDMVCRIIDLSKSTDHGLDVNSKSNGGYTPLHIAAIHSKISLIKLLVQKYAANRNVRDNCGKKPYYYLRKNEERDVRVLLGDPKATRQESQQARDDYDPNKNPKNRLFPQNPVGLKKKNKARSQFMSVAEDGRAERDEPVSSKQRLTSDVFH